EIADVAVEHVALDGAGRIAAAHVDVHALDDLRSACGSGRASGIALAGSATHSAVSRGAARSGLGGRSAASRLLRASVACRSADDRLGFSRAAAVGSATGSAHRALAARVGTALRRGLTPLG